MSTFTRTLNKVKRTLPFSLVNSKAKKSNIGAETLLKINSDDDYQSENESKSQDESQKQNLQTSRKRSAPASKISKSKI